MDPLMIIRAYDKGYEAYLAGLSRDSNPYRGVDEDELSDSWLNGWDQAALDD